MHTHLKAGQLVSVCVCWDAGMQYITQMKGSVRVSTLLGQDRSLSGSIDAIIRVISQLGIGHHPPQILCLQGSMTIKTAASRHTPQAQSQ